MIKNEFRIHQSQRIQRNEVRKDIFTKKRSEKILKTEHSKKKKKKKKEKDRKKACFGWVAISSSPLWQDHQK